MKQYVIDELRPDDFETLKRHLDAHFAVPNFEGLYRISLDAELWSEVQKAHSECQPFYLALELLPDRLACELLVRTNSRARCECIQTATEAQRNWLIQSIDAIFDSLAIMA
jgi:hypothetical protein